jgi:hypothetical protein
MVETNSFLTRLARWRSVTSRPFASAMAQQVAKPRASANPFH